MSLKDFFSTSGAAKKNAAHQFRCDILILTGSVGNGHISVARAITDALYRDSTHQHKKDLRVETIDLMSSFQNIVTTATKKIYLNSLKISPKFYAMLFKESGGKKWPLQTLNTLGAPFMQKKFAKILETKQPRVLISTYPVWDILVKKVWDRYRKNRRLPFIKIITDSATTMHSAWMQGDPDSFLVANDDTHIALRNRGISAERIKVFGYPVSGKFIRHEDCRDFKKTFNLSPRRKTLLLILTGATGWHKAKKILEQARQLSLPNLQLVIIAAGDPRWKEKIRRMAWKFPTEVTGWTTAMHTAIHAADIVITKAGGATVMECIASGKPMVIFETIPGQETGNAALVEKYNLGAVLEENAADLSPAIQYILTNEPLIRKNLLNQQRPHAAEDTAKFLLGLL